MVKKTNLITLALLLLFGLNNFLLAQSDYEKVMNFKNRYKSIEDSVKSARTFDNILKLQDDLQKLKNDFAPDKNLLDKSLYPDNFNSAIEKLERTILIRKGDFSQIVELKTQVDTLREMITSINEKNANLITQIRELQLSQKKDKAAIESLHRLVASLKANIQQRDELVGGIVDSLLGAFIHKPSNLSDAEKQNIFDKVDSGNLFYNIERAITDNIQFLNVTTFMPDDLSQMKKQYKDFSKLWGQIGPKLASIYLNKTDKIREISLINNMFDQWNQKITNEIWSSVNKEFREKEINLLGYNTGEEFTNSLKNYIEDEIKNAAVRRKSEALKTLDTFADSVWFGKVKPVWIPLLIDNNLMTEAQKDTVESRIAQWKETVAPGGIPIWIYVIVALLIISFFMALFRKRKKPPLIKE